MKTPRTTSPTDSDPQRIAKVMARAGLCSRRAAEAWIAEGRVAINGRTLDSPAITVKPGDDVTVDGQPLPQRDRTRLWLFHKPKGLVTTTHDPEGRPTVFAALPPDLPRVMTVGRLDINTEGLLLLTNDGGLARVMELPSTGWLRRYRVRVHGAVDQALLDTLRDGIAVDGILYGAIEATLDRRQGDNAWLTMGLREGKNREIKNVLMHLGLDVNRLIRVSFGPFQLGDLAEGAVTEVPRRHLQEQLGETLAATAGADFGSREDDRKPKMPRGPARTASPVADRSDPRPAPRPANRAPSRSAGSGRRTERPEASERPSTGKARRPDASRSRRRHEADLDHNADPVAPARRRPTLALKSGPVRETRDGSAPAAPRSQKSRRDVAETRRSGAPRPEAVVERKPRRPRDAETDGGPADGRRNSGRAVRAGDHRTRGDRPGANRGVPSNAGETGRRSRPTGVPGDAPRRGRPDAAAPKSRPPGAGAGAGRTEANRFHGRGPDARSDGRRADAAPDGRGPRSGSPSRARPDDRGPGGGRPGGDRTDGRGPRGGMPGGDRPDDRGLGRGPRDGKPDARGPRDGKPDDRGPGGGKPGGGRPKPRGGPGNGGSGAARPPRGGSPGGRGADRRR